MKIKVIHLITSLGCGGAEKVLYNLVLQSNIDKFEYVIISLKDLGFYGQMFKDVGVKVYVLNVSKLAPWKLFKLLPILKLEKPDIVQSWLYHADLVTLIPYCVGYKKIVWNIRNNTLDWVNSSKLTIFIRKLCAWLSFIPCEIICCAHTACASHIKIGYKQEKFTIIGNGYDFTKYVPSGDTRNLLRQKLNILPSEIIIGNVGRYDPAKDHVTLIKALKIVYEANPDFRLLLIGKNISSDNKELFLLIKNANLERHVILLPEQHNIECYYNIMDIFVLSSNTEAFPNVLVEAMATQLPCITTDAGDAKKILGADEFVVSIKNPMQIATKVLNLLSKPKAERIKYGECLRNRVVETYSIEVMVKRYEDLYFKVFLK